NAHDLVVVGPGGDLVFRRQRAIADDQAVIAGRREGVGHAGVDRAAVVVDLIGLAVHEPGGALDDGAGGETDALVPEAHAEHRQLWAEMADDVVGHTALPRRAGAR